MSTAAAPVDRTFPALNAIRAAGALMVLATHSAFDTGRILEGWSGAVLARFDFGVTLFFVLSGFLLSRPFLLASARGENRPSTRHYLWKRALRILPLYWIVVIAAFLVEPDNRMTTTGDWLRHLTLTQLYEPGLLATGLTQMWSLCTEVAFYLALPLLCVLLVTNRSTRSAWGLPLTTIYVKVGVVAVLGVVWQTWMSTVPGREGHFAQWLPGYLPWFCAGVAFAAVSASLTVSPRDHVFERLGRDAVGCWIIATAVFAIACTPLAGPLTLDPPTGWSAFFKCVLYGVAGSFYVLPLVFGPEREGRIRQFCCSRVPFYLGEISFGIFCIHVLVMKWTFRNLEVDIFTGRFEEIFLTTLIITILLAALSYRFVERPFLRLKNAGPFAGRARQATSRASTASS
ncbi:MAG: acyltransferase family protein [Nocardioidaceae bacterium]